MNEKELDAKLETFKKGLEQYLIFVNHGVHGTVSTNMDKETISDAIMHLVSNDKSGLAVQAITRGIVMSYESGALLDEIEEEFKTGCGIVGAIKYGSMGRNLFIKDITKEFDRISKLLEEQ